LIKKIIFIYTQRKDEQKRERYNIFIVTCCFWIQNNSLYMLSQKF